MIKLISTSYFYNTISTDVNLPIITMHLKTFDVHVLDYKSAKKWRYWYRNFKYFLSRLHEEHPDKLETLFSYLGWIAEWLEPLPYSDGVLLGSSWAFCRALVSRICLQFSLIWWLAPLVSVGRYQTACWCWVPHSWQPDDDIASCALQSEGHLWPEVREDHGSRLQAMS